MTWQAAQPEARYSPFFVNPAIPIWQRRHFFLKKSSTKSLGAFGELIGSGNGFNAEFALYTGGNAAVCAPHK